MPRPIMFMLAGPNGAGKSTLYERVIRPRVAAPFINADLIQRDELRNPSMAASYDAARIAEQRRRDHLAGRHDFVSESTFSHPSKLDLITRAQDAGFAVALYHVNVRDADLSVKRVASRTRAGGHDVPEDKIRERYARNQALIRQAMLQADYGFVYDNSRWNEHPERVIDFKAGRVIRVSATVPAWARELYAQELRNFGPSRLDPAAASFAEAKSIVERLAAEATLSIAQQSSAWRGEVVAETAQHWVQHAGDRSYVAHLKSAMDAPLQLHQVLDISYPERGRALAKPVRIEDVERGRAMADAFLTMPEDRACAKFPELVGAYQALRTISKAMAQDDANASDVARTRLAEYIRAGRVPPPSPQQGSNVHPLPAARRR